MAATIPADRWTPAGPMRSHLPIDEIEREEGLAQSSVADPTTMGLYGFAAGTFTLSAVNAGWFPATTAIFAAPVVLVVGGIVQFSAGMWAYRKGDTFAASGFGAIGGFNVAYGLYQLLSHTGVISGPGAGAGVIGIFLACFGLIATIQMVAALWKNMALVVTFLFLALTYGLLGAGNIAAGAPNLLHYGGYAGLITSVCAFYVAAAVVINSTSQRQILPLGKPLDSAPGGTPIATGGPSGRPAGRRNEALG